MWAGLFLFPLIGKSGFSDLGGVGWWRALILAALAGPVQGILSATGFLLTPLGHGAVIQPGTAALTGFLLATLVLHEALTLRRMLGACAIVAGLMLLAAEAVTTIGRHGVAGDLLFIVAGAFWAAFTILIRLWGIRATQAVAAIGVVSLVVYAPLHGLLFGFDHMRSAGMWENLLQIVVQGIFAGALAIHLASRAVILLGAGSFGGVPCRGAARHPADRFDISRRSADAGATGGAVRGRAWVPVGAQTVACAPHAAANLRQMATMPLSSAATSGATRNVVRRWGCLVESFVVAAAWDADTQLTRTGAGGATLISGNPN